MEIHHDQEEFLKVQRLALACAKEVGSQIRPGWTEKKTASLMETYLKDSGVDGYFHRPYAWFGGRTRFAGMTQYWHANPSLREYRDDDAVILDCAPIVNGYIADIGYSFCRQPSEKYGEALKLLEDLRQALPSFFSGEWTRREIWEKVDQVITLRGFENRHQLYPFAVLGHRVFRSRFSRFPGLIKPFSVQALGGLIWRGILPPLLTPNSEGELAGLWAIEPHLGCVPPDQSTEGFGAKFEEILLVEPSKTGSGFESRWIEDHPQGK